MLQICSKEGALTEIVKELPCHFVITIGALSPPHFLLHGLLTLLLIDVNVRQAGGSDCALVSRRPPSALYDAEPMSPGKIGENEGAKFFCHTGFRMQRLLLPFSR